MEEEMEYLQKNETWGNYLRVRRQLGANGYLQRKTDFLTSMMPATRQGWWLKVTLGRKELTTMRYFLQL